MLSSGLLELKISFKYKLFIAFLFYGFSLVFLTQFIIFKINEMSIKSVSIQKAQEIFVQRDDLFRSYIQDINLKIEAVKKSTLFTRFLNNPQEKDLVQSLFIDIATTADNIMQLRYIDKQGVEVIRVDRDEYGSDPFLISKDKLQDKSDRYYFKDIMKLHSDELWYSNLDLNIEHGEIEKPVKPVIRLGVALFKDGEKNGILIINILMKNFLNELIHIPSFEIYLSDSKGNILIDSIHKHCWSKYLKNDETVFNTFGIDAGLILQSDEYIGKNFYSNKLSLDNGENLRMIIKPNDIKIQDEIDKQISELMWIMFGVVLLSFPFAYFFSKTPIKLNQQIDTQKHEQDVLLSLFDLSDAVLIKWNNDENWSVSSVSKSVEKLLGYTQENFEKNSILYSMCIHHDDIKKVVKEVDDAIKSKVYFFEHQPYRVITKEGGVKWILDSTVIVRDKYDNINSFVGYLIDITEIKDNEIALIKLSRTDQLTKIYNRMHLDDVLQNQHYRCLRDNETTSIILVDIDFFKLVNDEYGHLVGDSVLIEFANIIKDSIRAGDTLGRWGGEEFLIILPHTDINQAIQLAEKLRVKVEQNIFSVVKHKTASFGIASLEKGMSIESLIDRADKGLYKAKEIGRNCLYAIEDNLNKEDNK